VPEPSFSLSKVLTQLLSLNTATARRIFELALLLGLIFAAGYISEHSHSEGVQIGAGIILVGSCVGAAFVVIRLLREVVQGKE
jgi:hypothetical protein